MPSARTLQDSAPVARILWHNTTSLDGYVALPGDDMSWMAPFVGPNQTVREVLPQIGAILMGARTYAAVRADARARPYGGAIEVPYLVLTHADPDSAPTGFTFLGGELADVARAAREVAGERYVAVLGQQAGRALLAAGELDEILIHMTPATLGRGVAMFGSETAPAQLELKLCRQSSQVVDLWFEVRRPRSER